MKSDPSKSLNDCLKPEINDSVHTICTHYSVPCNDLVAIAKQKGHPSIADQVTAAAEIPNRG